MKILALGFPLDLSHSDSEYIGVGMTKALYVLNQTLFEYRGVKNMCIYILFLKKNLGSILLFALLKLFLQ